MTDAFWACVGIVATGAFGVLTAWIAQNARREAKKASDQSSENSVQLSKVHEKVNGTHEEAVRNARKRAPAQVLVIDDDDNDQEIQAIILRRCGCEVFQAKTGLEAQELILSRIRSQRGYPFDLIFLDVKLSRGEDARDVLEILEQIVPDILVVILTGQATGEIVKEICKDGRFLITKPLTEKHVRGLLHKLGLA